MRRLLLFLCLTAPLSLHAATWYATSSSVNVNQASLWVPTHTGTCTGSGTALTFGNQANGDTFDANGCTALAINVDMGGSSVEVTLQTTTAGGAFTLSTANLGTMVTLHANITAGSTTVVTISGSSGCGTIIGNVLGGSSSSALGVSDSHTVCTINLTGNITGGSAASAYGYETLGAGASTLLAVTGNVTTGTAASVVGLFIAATGPATVTGNCVGSNTVVATACYGSAGLITITGNMINGTKGGATQGMIFYTPNATNYTLWPKDSSYTLNTINTHSTLTPLDPGAANVKNGLAYGPNTGTYLGVTALGLQ